MNFYLFGYYFRIQGKTPLNLKFISLVAPLLSVIWSEVRNVWKKCQNFSSGKKLYCSKHGPLNFLAFLKRLTLNFWGNSSGRAILMSWFSFASAAKILIIINIFSLFRFISLKFSNFKLKK